MEYLSHSPAETVEIGKALAARLTPGSVLALEGDLGMGKTCLTSGIAAGLGYTGPVNSPTFALVQEYRGGRLPVFHFDMYRVEGWADLESTGFFDYLEAGGVMVIEWSEHIAAALPPEAISITIRRVDDHTRRIEVCDP